MIKWAEAEKRMQNGEEVQYDILTFSIDKFGQLMQNTGMGREWSQQSYNDLLKMQFEPLPTKECTFQEAAILAFQGRDCTRPLVNHQHEILTLSDNQKLITKIHGIDFGITYDGINAMWTEVK